MHNFFQKDAVIKSRVQIRHGKPSHLKSLFYDDVSVKLGISVSYNQEVKAHCLCIAPL